MKIKENVITKLISRKVFVIDLYVWNKKNGIVV